MIRKDGPPDCPSPFFAQISIGFTMPNLIESIGVRVSERLA